MKKFKLIVAKGILVGFGAFMLYLLWLGAGWTAFAAIGTVVGLVWAIWILFEDEKGGMEL